MDVKTLKGILENAISSLFVNQDNIFDFTSETNQTEWNLAHHYANEINNLLSDFDCDLDIVKTNLGNQRPDIIFHLRGKQESNFLVIEVKLDGSPSKLKADIEKIKSSWFGDRLHYKFGAVVNLESNKTGQVEVFENPSYFKENHDE